MASPPASPAPPAKLTPPKLLGALARERLFASLDALRRRPAVWVVGPPGAGKTTLVASYLQARVAHCLWYQLDAGDADAASFFYYLAQAAPRARAGGRGTARAAEPLRMLAPEYLADLPSFTRRFFRALFERLPNDTTLVLDNFQDAGAAPSLHEIVRDAIGEARGAQCLIVLSRIDPPAALARAQANGQVGLLGWDELRLTVAETHAIAAAERPVDAALLQRLQQQSGGWAAGLALLLQHARHSGSVEAAGPAPTPAALFDYFAGQVFDQVSAATRELLLRTAPLPRISAAAAQALTGDAEAPALLDELHRRRLFIERHAGAVAVDAPATYQLHALFRDFLLSVVAATFTPDQQRLLKTRCAQWLAGSGEIAEALQLHAANADWDAATALILKHARGLIAEGRWLTLKAWIGLLPPAHVERTPWLTLWLGSGLVLVDPQRARATLERAFGRFAALDDALGQALAASGIIESHNIEQHDFAVLDVWIGVLEPLLRRGLAFPSATVRLRVHAALMLALMLRQPAHPMLAAGVRELGAALGTEIAPTARADLAIQLLQFHDFTGDLPSAIALAAQAGPLFEGDALSPLRRSGWWVFYSYHAALVGQQRAGFDALDRLRAIAQETGLTWFGFFDLFFRSLLHLLGPAPLAAAPLLQPLGALVQPGRAADAAQYHLARVLLYQAQHEPSLALYHGELCLEAAARNGGALFNVLFPTVVASACVEAGQPGRALALVAQARALGAVGAYRHLEPLMRLVEAYAQAAAGDTRAALGALAQALGAARSAQTEPLLRWLVVGLRRMLALALRHGIEAESARALIERFGLPAESPDVEPWPWPIRIHTLGRFALVIGGAPLHSERKVQKKPLEMLKVVVAQGGREVGSAALEAALWPDADGAAAAQAFEVTLRRLRKLLGNDEALALKDGKLALHAGLCWVDAWAFERAQARAETLLDAAASPAALPRGADSYQLDADTETDAALEHALALYPGHFLAGDDDKPWLLGCRQRLASKFMRLVQAAGQRWHARGDTAKAELAYRRALELDPLAEPLYQRLIALQLQQGRRAEALESYRRCRQMLSVVLGLAPSAQTEALHRELIASA